MDFGNDRLEEQAEVVIDNLSKEQRGRAFPGDPNPMGTWITQRRAVLDAAARGEYAGDEEAEFASAQAAADEVSPVYKALDRKLRWPFIVFGWTFVGSGLLSMALAWLSGGAPNSSRDDWVITGASGVFFVICCVALAVGGLLLLVRTSLTRRHQRAVRKALIDWAVDRPGQLARGLPAVDAAAFAKARRAQREDLSLLDHQYTEGMLADRAKTSPMATCGVWALVIIGGSVVLIGVVTTFFSLAANRAGDTQISAIVGLAGAALIGAAWLVKRRSGATNRRDAILREALAKPSAWHGMGD